MPHLSLRQQLYALEGAGLIALAASPTELEYLFRHMLVKEAAYISLVKGDRQALHRAVAGVLEQQYRADPTRADLLPVLAHHCDAAREAARALEYFTLAGDAAFARYANTEAAEHYARALAWAEAAGASNAQLLHLHQQRGRALELGSRFEEALQTYAGLENAGRQRGDDQLVLAALIARATILSTANLALDPEQAADALKQARQLAEAVGDRAIEARLEWNLLLLNTMQGGDRAERRQHGERALALARQLGLREQLAYALTDVWFVYNGTHQWPQAVAALEEARALWRELGLLVPLAEATLRLSQTRHVRGDFEASQALADEALRLAQAANSRDMQGLSRAFTGMTYFDQGETATAIATMEAALRLGSETGNVTVLIGTRADLGFTYGWLGDEPRGLALAQQAHAMAQASFPLLAAWPASQRARLLIRQQRLAEAEAALAGVPGWRDMQQRLGFLSFAWVTHSLATAELALARGDPAAAHRAAADLRAAVEAAEVVYVRPEMLWVEGLALLGLGRLALARAALQEAHRAALALDNRRLLWRILASLAEVEQRSGAGEAALNWRRSARRALEPILARLPGPDWQARFTAQPEVRALLAE